MKEKVKVSELISTRYLTSVRKDKGRRKVFIVIMPYEPVDCESHKSYPLMLIEDILVKVL